MEIEILRMIAAALNHATAGVNALLPTVPRDVTDQAPPQIKQVYEETSTGWLARGELPDEMRDPSKYPLLVVTLLADIDYGSRSRPTANAGGLVRGEFVVSVQYATHASLTEKGEQDGLYTCRVVRSVIQRLFAQDRAADRQRNKVQMEVLKDVKQMRAFETIEDTAIVAGIVVISGTAHEASW